MKVSTLLHTATTRLKLKALGCTVCKGFKIDGKLWIWAQKRYCTRIGDNLRINSLFGSNLVGLTNPAIFLCIEGGTITIGTHSGLSAVVLSAHSNITIVEYAKIGGNVRIYDHDFHSLDFIKQRAEKVDP